MDLGDMLAAEKEQFPFPKYRHLTSLSEAIIISQNDVFVTVKYLDSKHEVDYKISYFDKMFNPIIE